MTLRTPSKSILLTQNTSELDEIVIQGNSSVYRLGQQPSIVWDIGQSDRDFKRPREWLLEANLGIDARQSVAPNISQYTFTYLWQFVEAFEILINDTTVHETVSGDLQHARLYVNRLLQQKRNEKQYQSTFCDDMADHSDPSSYDPYGSGNCSSITIKGDDPVANGGSGYVVSNHLEYFFDGIFKQLPLNRIRKIEIRLRLIPRADSSKFKFVCDPAGLDGSRLTQLPVFNNFRLRVRYEKFANKLSDPVPTSLPLVLYSPRYEMKSVKNPFANGNRVIRINLRTDFSAHKMFNCVHFLALRNGREVNATDANPIDSFVGWSDSSTWFTIFKKIEVVKNGTVQETYTGEQELRAYYNRILEHEWGHSTYTYRRPTENGVDPFNFIYNLVESTEIPYISFRGIHHKPLQPAQVDSTLVVSGKTNQYDTWELVFYANDTYRQWNNRQIAPESVELISEINYIMESPTMGELNADGSVRTTGR